MWKHLALIKLSSDLTKKKKSFKCNKVSTVFLIEMTIWFCVVICSKENQPWNFAVQKMFFFLNEKRTIVLLLLKIYTISILFPVHCRESDEYSMFLFLITFKIWTKPLNTSFNPFEIIVSQFHFLIINYSWKKILCQVLIEKKMSKNLSLIFILFSNECKPSSHVRKFVYLS